MLGKWNKMTGEGSGDPSQFLNMSIPKMKGLKPPILQLIVLKAQMMQPIVLLELIHTKEKLITTYPQSIQISK